MGRHLWLAPQLAFVDWIHGASDGTLEDFGEYLIILEDTIGSVFARAVHLLGVLFITVVIQNFTPNLHDIITNFEREHFFVCILITI